MESKVNRPVTRSGRPSLLSNLNGLTQILDVIRGRKSLVDYLGLTSPERDRLAFVLRLRNRHMLLMDLVSLALIPSLALALRLDGFAWPPGAALALAIYTVIALIVRLVIFYEMDLYRRYWRYAGVSELARLALAVGISTFVLAFLFPLMYISPITASLASYRSLPLIAGLLTFMAVGGSRFGLRGIYQLRKRRKDVTPERRLLVVGAGEAGMMVIREIEANPQLKKEVVALVDDDPYKVGTWIAGVPVVGTLENIPALMVDLQIQEVILAIPSAPLARQRQIADLCEQSGLPVSQPPAIYELLAGYKTVSQVPLIDLHSLLEREPIASDPSDIASLLQGAKVMVTGAGGSIGSELCHQIAAFKPAEIVLLGHGENSIFQIALNLRLAFPDLVTYPLISDIRDEKGIDWAFDRYRPHVVFHAAAHKHVHFMEENASEAITNNVLGTMNLLCAAKRYDVARFVLISSDKAVNPTSIMGATKRIAELLVKAAASETGRAYMAVRFGNVLGSRGSVVPLFQRQIQAGGPLTITHPDMRRYFMTIPEAVQLVMQAAFMGSGGEVFTLDMGEQIRIVDLASRLVSRSGFQIGRDIDLVFTGIRPGEKLQEELFLSSEKYARTKHDKVFVAVDRRAGDTRSLDMAVTELVMLAQQRQPEAAIRKMQAIIPNYRPYVVPGEDTAVPDQPPLYVRKPAGPSLSPPPVQPPKSGPPRYTQF